MSQSDLNEKIYLKQEIGIKKRFPQLPDDIIQSTWSGMYQELEIVLKFLKNLMKIYLLQVVTMVLELVLVLYLVNKLQLKQVTKIQKR